MTDTDREGLQLSDEDRLPWLEAVDDADEDEGISPAKLVGGVLGALVALGVVIAGVWWIKDRNAQPDGDGTLIAAAEGDYKVKPDQPGGMKVEGEGDSSFATSEGAEAQGKIDTSALPEAPVAPVRPAAKPAPANPVAGGPAAATVKVAQGGKMPAPAPKPTAKPQPAAAGPAGSVVQLGAYGSEAIANQQWGAMSKRFAFLASLDKVIVPVNIGGNTLYRLRVNAGSVAAASSLCGKLKVAGENCLIAAN
jgi:cell division protein FtsN